MQNTFFFKVTELLYYITYAEWKVIQLFVILLYSFVS